MNNISPQRQREIALYRYHKALERGDFETTSAILKQAERDPQLNQMIAELDRTLESASEWENPYSDLPLIGSPVSSNGQPPKLDLNKEQPDMTTQARYWEPRQAAGRANRFAAVVVLLLTALVVGGVFFFMIPSRTSIQTMVLQVPTPTVAEIAKLYVDEIWGKGNHDVAKTLLAANFVDHDPLFVNYASVATATDKNNDKVFNFNVSVLHVAFPSVSVKLDDVVITDDHIVVRWTATGAQKGILVDIPATGKSVSFTNIDILLVKDGKITERWGENKLEFIKNQIGVTDVTQNAADAVSAFARFGYMVGSGTVNDLSPVFSDDIIFNQQTVGLKAVQTDVISTIEQLKGITNMRIISATVIGDHLVAEVKFETNNGTTQNHGRVEITLKDGKITSYNYFDGQ